MKGEFEQGNTKPIATTAAMPLAFGIPEVADLRAKRDGCQVLYDAIQESIYLTKKELDTIESDIKAARGGN